ncbi:hypothetical protein, partial [Gluconobacter cerinus]
LEVLARWLEAESIPLRAYAAGISTKLFTQKATNVAGADVLALPFPEDGDLDLSDNERIIAEDIVFQYREFIRKGSESRLLREDAGPALEDFARLFCK